MGASNERAASRPRRARPQGIGGFRTCVEVAALASRGARTMFRAKQGDLPMAYVVTGLPVDEFRPLFGLSDAELAARGIVRHTADEPVGFPCRITLEDAPVGETLLLLNYEHQPADTPYR